jgi:NADH-quinone oxidoreductase subunit G
MLNRQRCILCTRCVRFMKDIDGDAQIGIQDRGYGSQIITFQEGGVHSLLSGNLMDVCPVGAITTRDYRFKSRPWDNPFAVDSICTLCSKGCNVTVWLRAKPEWAKGPRLARITPRYNPEVNDFWMCDIGRYDYHFVEGEDRPTRPLRKTASGVLEPESWRDVMVKLREAVGASAASPRIRFLASAHASLEELVLLGQIARGLYGDGAERQVAVSWRTSEKEQPEGTKFKVPRVDAPNVAGAMDLGVGARPLENGEPDISELKKAVAGGEVDVLYVLDPGPAASLGDTSWIVAAREAGLLKVLAVQTVVLGDLARAADFVLAGASYVEKDASYTNDKGMVQVTSRAIPPPGYAMEDWQILVNLGVTLGVGLSYTSSAHIRADIAAAMPDRPGYSQLPALAFNRPKVARTWLQTSNPSERWKWDTLFQDLPPVKFKGSPERTSRRDLDPQAEEEPKADR